MDKLLHFTIGLIVSLIAGTLYTPVFGLLGAVLSGAWKEIIWDKVLSRGTPEILDFVATVAGGALGAVILHAAR